jgi:hypothetical protein
METKGQHINCEQDEEHILRRLGGAVVVLWDKLPENARSKILAQATQMHDGHQIVELGEQIEGFIERYKPAPRQ